MSAENNRNTNSKINSKKHSSKKLARKKRKTRRLIMRCIIGFNICVILGLLIYLTVFFVTGNKKEKAVSDNSLAVSEDLTVSEDIVEEPVMTKEEFLASWDSTDSDLSLAKVGDVICFGRYEQDGDDTNFLEPIEWDVLDSDNGTLLLISHKIIDTKPYHTPMEYITWEECTLRKWLNDDFVDAAFNDNEKAKLQSVSVNNPDSFEFYEPFYSATKLKVGAKGGNDTEDKVFLLSYDELIKYYELTPAEDFIGYVSDKLIAEPVDALDMNVRGYSNWWLRSPADNCQYAMYVSEDFLQCISGNIDDENVGIRPVMWVKY